MMLRKLNISCNRETAARTALSHEGRQEHAAVAASNCGRIARRQNTS